METIVIQEANVDVLQHHISMFSYVNMQSIYVDHTFNNKANYLVRCKLWNASQVDIITESIPGNKNKEKILNYFLSNNKMYLFLSAKVKSVIYFVVIF